MAARAGAAALGFALVLASCADDAPPADPNAATGCPRIGVPEDLSDVLMLRDGRPERASLIAASAITNTFGRCSYGDGKVNVELNVDFETIRGPAIDLERTMPVTYFVAIADAGNNVLGGLDVGQQRFQLDLPIQGRNERFPAEYRDAIEVQFPVPLPREGTTYQVVIGFMLTREQLDLNRALRQQQNAPSRPPVLRPAAPQP